MKPKDPSPSLRLNLTLHPIRQGDLYTYLQSFPGGSRSEMLRQLATIGLAIKQAGGSGPEPAPSAEELRETSLPPDGQKTGGVPEEVRRVLGGFDD